MTAGRTKIVLPVINNNNSTSKKELFFNKPKVNLTFKNHVTDQQPTKKRRTEDLDNHNTNNMDSLFKKHDVHFDNCTFNNCSFKITSCFCDKENNY